MRRGRQQGRGHAPGMGRYVWGSVLLHLCVAVGLSLWSGADERGSFMPASLPLRVTLLHPDPDAEKPVDVVPGKPAPLLPGGDPSPSPHVASPVAPAEPMAEAPAAPPPATEAPSPPVPPSASEPPEPPPAPPAPRRPAPPPEGRLSHPPRRPAPVRPQPLGPDREALASPAITRPEAPPLERSDALSPSPPAEPRGPRAGSLPLLSDEDLAKYAQLPAGQPQPRPLRGVDAAISLNTTEVKYLAYFAHLKEKIDRQWHYPAEASARGVEGQLVLVFVLQRSGQVSRVELLRSAGAKVLDQAAWEAVLKASPFDPVPPHISEEPLRIRARFTYLLEDTARRTRVQ